MQTQTSEEIKKIIIAELPRFVESDPGIRKFILNLAPFGRTFDRITGYSG